jgi:DNA-binding beta-propeller fold protein YncE
VVVANRGAGSLSAISVPDLSVDTFPMPPGPKTPEPMYVVSGGPKRVLVGDRGNNRVVIFDRRTLQPLGEVPTGAGVFHMWASAHQLWVNNDIDKTASVFQLPDLQPLATVPMPADLVALGGRPHDVVVGHEGFAFVTMVGVAGASDYVVQFDVRTFLEAGRAAVGKDPHVALDERREQLFVPAQGSNRLHVLDAETLELLQTLEIPGAHGAALSPDARHFYTTNLPGGGLQALFTIDTKRLSVIADPVEAPFPTPHNVVITRDQTRAFVTHSGATSTQVSVYRLDRRGMPHYETTLTAGVNPFGISFVK